MSVPRRKQSIIQQLRRRISRIEANGKPLNPRPASRERIRPAIFASGLHEIVGDTPANFTAATAFALIEAAQGRGNARPLFFATPPRTGRSAGSSTATACIRSASIPTACYRWRPDKKELLGAMGTRRTVTLGVCFQARHQIWDLGLDRGGIC
jgi:hypothetical protein